MPAMGAALATRPSRYRWIMETVRVKRFPQSFARSAL